MTTSNKGNTGEGRKRRSIQAHLLALIHSVAVVTALLSTCHFIFVPSLGMPSHKHPIQKFFRNNNNNSTTSVASISGNVHPEPTYFEFGDDDDDDDFASIGSNETSISFWGSLRSLVRTTHSETETNNNLLTRNSLRQTAQPP